MLCVTSGTGPYISAMNFGNLFAKPSLFISANTGAFAASGWVYLGVEKLYSAGGRSKAKAT